MYRYCNDTAMIPTANSDRIPTDKTVGFVYYHQVSVSIIGICHYYASSSLLCHCLCFKYSKLQAQNDIHCLSGSILHLSYSISCMRAFSSEYSCICMLGRTQAGHERQVHTGSVLFTPTFQGATAG